MNINRFIFSFEVPRRVGEGEWEVKLRKGHRAPLTSYKEHRQIEHCVTEMSSIQISFSDGKVVVQQTVEGSEEEREVAHPTLGSIQGAVGNDARHAHNLGRDAIKAATSEDSGYEEAHVELSGRGVSDMKHRAE